MVPLVVLDTNILVAAVRSRRGASFQLLSRLAAEKPGFRIVLSVPLVLEYEEALCRHEPATGLKREDVDDLLDYLCSIGRHQEIFYLWRPVLRDPRDDHVLEVAVAAAADAIVTFNTRDFRPAETFGVPILRPNELLKQLGNLE